MQEAARSREAAQQEVTAVRATVRLLHSEKEGLEEELQVSYGAITLSVIQSVVAATVFPAASLIGCDYAPLCINPHLCVSYCDACMQACRCRPSGRSACSIVWGGLAMTCAALNGSLAHAFQCAWHSATDRAGWDALQLHSAELASLRAGHAELELVVRCMEGEEAACRQALLLGSCSLLALPVGALARKGSQPNRGFVRVEVGRSKHLQVVPA